MTIEIGRIEALYRFPVKSMQGEQLETATMGWHGIDGDRRFAFRRVDERGGNPWLSGGRLPELLAYAPRGQQDGGPPTHVNTPEGSELPLFDDALAAEVGRRHGAPVQMMQLEQGIFDVASISVISYATVDELGRLSGTSPDVRRFRPNLLVRTTREVAFEEDDWVGGVLTFGEGADAPAVAVTMRDHRCSMINIDPDEDGRTPEVMKACVRANQGNAGIYCTVTRTGQLAVGQSIVLHR